MTPFVRFLAFEVIGWFVAAIVLTVAVQNDWVTVVQACVLFVIWVAKDFALYPLTKRAYEHGPTHGSHELIGTVVVVEQALEPEGYVLAGRERWRARLVAGVETEADAEAQTEARDGVLPVGARVRVTALEGISLVVEPAGEDESLEP